MMDDPYGADYVIKRALREDWDVTLIAKCIDADHKVDDIDENTRINRKTGHIGKMYNRERSMKEIKNGLMSFTLVSNHKVKTHIDGDVVHKGTRKAINLQKSREVATELHLKDLNVDALLEFTDVIHRKGLDWPVKQFLTTVLPWWENRVPQSSSELPPVAVEDPDMLALQDRLYPSSSSTCILEN